MRGPRKKYEESWLNGAQVRWAGRWVAFVDWSAPPSEEYAYPPPAPSPAAPRPVAIAWLPPTSTQRKLCLCRELVCQLSVYGGAL